MKRFLSILFSAVLLFTTFLTPIAPNVSAAEPSYETVVLRGDAATLDWSSNNNPLQYDESEKVWKSAPISLQGGKKVEFKFVMNGEWMSGENLVFTPAQTGDYVFVFHPEEERKVDARLELQAFTGSLTLEVKLPEGTPDWAVPTIGSSLNQFNYEITPMVKIGENTWQIVLAGNAGEEIEYLYALGDPKHTENRSEKRKVAFVEEGKLYKDEVAEWKSLPVAKNVSHQYQFAPAVPSAGDDVTITVEVDHFGTVSNGAAYYTLDGSRPEGVRGEPANGTAVKLSKQSEKMESGLTKTVFKGTIPKQADGTTVKYIIDVWAEDGVGSQYADSNTLTQEGADEFAYLAGKFESPGWAKEAIIYHVFVDRFNNGDPANDAPVDPNLPIDEKLKGWMGGDIKGVIDRLDYIKDLGANTIWLSPVYEGPYSHGYHPADFVGVENHFGSKDLLKQLVETAQAKGMKVVYDFVANHSSNQHPFFKDAQARGENSSYYHWYNFIQWPDQYETFYGIGELPKFNNNDPEARQYMLDQVVPYWLDEIGFDGFRLDHATGPSYSFWVDFRKKVKELKPDAFIFGEIWEPREKIDSYAGELDGALDFDLRGALVDTLAKDQPLSKLAETVEGNLNTFHNEYIMANFLDSHDQPRFLFEAGGNKDRLKLAAAAQFTLPGVPIIYYGDEVGLSQSKDHNSVTDWKDRYYREMMPWNTNDQDQDLRNFYTGLADLRISEPALSTGDYKTLAASQNLFAYEREEGEDQFLVVVNKGTSEENIDVNQLYNQAEILDVTLEEALGDETVGSDDKGNLSIKVGPTSFKIYKVNGNLEYSEKPLDRHKVYKDVVIRGSEPLSWDGEKDVLSYDENEKVWKSQPILLEAGKKVEFKYFMDGKWLDGDNLSFTPETNGEYVFVFDATDIRKVTVQPHQEKVTTKLTIHYQPKASDTKDWNLWVWPDGMSGQVFNFTGEDEFGKVAELELEGDHDRVGFIVRTDSWDKDGGDRFIDGIWEGSNEVWIKAGDDTVYTSNPDGGGQEKTYEELEVKFNYYRHDLNYDGWDIWVWTDKTEGQAVQLDKTTAFGKQGVLKLENLDGATKVGFIVRKSDWSEKDIGEDRFITKFTEDGKAEIWLAQGQKRIFDQPGKVDKHPRITKAMIDEMNVISFETNFSFSLSEEEHAGIQLEGADIKKVEAAPGTSGDLVNKVLITTEKELDLTKVYKVNKSGFGEATVQMGKVIGSDSFEEKFYYDGNDLGNKYSKENTKFRLWAPTASEARLVTYEKWDSAAGKEYVMERGEKGTWTAKLEGDQKGTLYTYKVKIGDKWNEAVDPYVRAVAVNGDRGAVIDLDETNPAVWTEDKPEFGNPEDAIIYESHIRDLTIHPESGVTDALKGKFLGVAEAGTTGPDGVKTGLSHIKDLGITHLQFIPMYDYNTVSVDETKLDTPQYNWGYDPKNYNAPEGSYSTDPYEPTVRINEMKQMIQTLHDNDIRIVMDVVYNHMFSAFESNLHQLVPGYYYRYNEDGTLSNGSGVGNDTASEHKMMRKFIVDSVVYWAEEYHIDGFRFDLMGIHDVETMNEVRKALDEIDPSIIIIGEGWDLATNLDPELKANQKNASKMPGIAHFNDDIRDGLKGSVFEDKDNGFVNGKADMETRIKKGVVGGISYSDELKTFADDPEQTVTYVEAHDNHTLWDKLELTNPNDSEEDRKKMHKLASATVLTSQGISFIHAGQEFMRTKGGDHNSYKSPDSVNQMDWERRAEFDGEVEYMKGLISLRKAYPAFRMTTAEEIKEKLSFIDSPANTVAFTLDGDDGSKLAVIYNANRTSSEIQLPENGVWEVLVNGDQAGTSSLGTIEGKVVTVEGLTPTVLVLKGQPDGGADPGDGPSPGEGTDPGEGTAPGEGTDPEEGTDPSDGAGPEEDAKPGKGVTPGDGSHPGEAGPGKQAPEKGSGLPGTATSMFNLMVAGLVLICSASIYLYLRKRRERHSA